jgi:Amt family ammonium transporter
MEGFWIVLLASAALLVRIGQMIGGVGVTRAKNAASAGFRSLADLCLASLCFWAIGAAIYFQSNNTIFGVNSDYLVGWRGLPINWFAMLAMIFIATGIVAPAVAERSTFAVPLFVGGLLSAILVPVIAHWTFGGWLFDMRFVDVAGAAAIHLAPAICAVTAVIFVGPRDGKYNRDRSSNMIPGHSVPMMLLAALFTLIGWVPYVLTAAAIRGIEIDGNLVAADIFIATAAGGLISLIVGRIRYGKADVLLALSGGLGAMVSITACAGLVGTPAAFFIGLVAGIVVPWATIFLDLKLKIDDAAGVVAVHGIGAIWALLAAAIFVPMTAADHFKIFGVQVLGIFVVAAIAIVLTIILMMIIKSTFGVRAREADEFDGLDLSQHDINAHPDFQQTTIKSYHLREM